MLAISCEDMLVRATDLIHVDIFGLPNAAVSMRCHNTSQSSQAECSLRAAHSAFWSPLRASCRSPVWSARCSSEIWAAVRTPPFGPHSAAVVEEQRPIQRRPISSPERRSLGVFEHSAEALGSHMGMFPTPGHTARFYIGRSRFPLRGNLNTDISWYT